MFLWALDILEVNSGKCSWSSVGLLVSLISSHFAFLFCLGYVISIVKMHVKVLSPSSHVSMMYPLGRGQPLPGASMFSWNVRNSGPWSSWKRRFSAWDIAGTGFGKWELIVTCPLSPWPALIPCPQGGHPCTPREGTQRSPSGAALGGTNQPPGSCSLSAVCQTSIELGRFTPLLEFMLIDDDVSLQSLEPFEKTPLSYSFKPCLFGPMAPNHRTVGTLHNCF